MGVRREEYIIVGVNVEPIEDHNDWYDQHESYMDNERIDKGEIYCLVDSMSSQYTIFGEVIKYGDEFEGLPLVEVDFKEIEEIKNRVHEKLKAELGIEEMPKLYVMTHWR